MSEVAGQRHPLCGGVWRGPFGTDNGPVMVCNACGAEALVHGAEGNS